MVQPDDNTLVIDPITGYLRTNPAYGDMYTYNGSQVVTIAVIDTFVQIPGGISAGQTRGFTFQSAKQLQCNVAGKYLVNWSLAIHMGSNNQEVEGCVMVNGAAQTPTACHTEVINSAKPAAMSGTGILTLAVNDLLQMAVANHTATNNVTIDHLTLSALQIA